MQALLAGQVDMLIDVPASSVPQIQAGTIKAYAVTAKSRLAAIPDVPTVDEAGLPGFYASIWYAMWVPKGTPKDVVAKLNEAVVDAVADPTVRKRLTDLGMEIFPGISRTAPRLARYTSLKSKGGGRSSTPPTSRVSERTVLELSGATKNRHGWIPVAHPCGLLNTPT